MDIGAQLFWSTTITVVAWDSDNECNADLTLRAGELIPVAVIILVIKFGLCKLNLRLCFNFYYRFLSSKEE